MKTKSIFQKYFDLLYQIAHQTNLKYECKDNPAWMIYQLEVHILSINNIEEAAFSSELNKCIENGIKDIENDIADLKQEFGIIRLEEILRQVEVCRNLLNNAKLKPGDQFSYFPNAKFDDDHENKVYISRMKNLNPVKEEPHDGFIYEQTDTDLKYYDNDLLRRCTFPYTYYYTSCLDLLKIKVNTLLSLRVASSVFLGTANPNYELRIGKRFTTIQFVYLFNILSRIDFIILRQNDHEKLFRVLADLYHSENGPHSNKKSNVKKIWYSSPDNEIIDRKSCKIFLEKVLKAMEDIVLEDIGAGYNSSTKRNKN
jgi:hypothetical protein